MRDELKNYLRETNLIEGRLIQLVLLIAFLTLVLLVRVWYLQVHSYQKFSGLSENNRISLKPVPPVRGQIIDRNGVVLADNTSVYTLEVIPSDVESLDDTIDRLSRLIPLTPFELKRFKDSVRSRPSFEAITLKLNLSDDEVARFAVDQQQFKGVSVKAVLQRSYPFKEELAHVLGYVGRISQQDLQRIDAKRYRGTRYIGKLGVEAYYESELLGEAGFEQVETNAHGRVIKVVESEPPKAGNTLQLSLDVNLQIAARKALGDKRGAIVAIDPNDGGVLAFVSNPSYDPNLFVNGIGHKEYNALREDINRPLLNRALNGRYAPGSTIKGLFALLGNQNGWQRRTVTCNGWFSLKGSSHKYRCWKREGHGTMDFAKAIIHSCDVYFYQLAHSLGIGKIHSFLKQFSLGRRTGLDLKGEPNGLVPSVEWKRRVKKTVWYPGETVITGIGQGYMLSTPIQLANMVATLASKGVSREPRIVSKVIGANGIVEKLPQQVVSRVEGVNISQYGKVIKAMEDVVHSERGTARGISVDIPYKMAGKTGTAQVVSIAQGAKYEEDKLDEFQRDHSLFVGFAPINKPEIAISIIVENGGSGSKTAAPIARKVIDQYLQVQAEEEVLADVAVNQYFLGEKEHN